MHTACSFFLHQTRTSCRASRLRSEQKTYTCCLHSPIFQDFDEHIDNLRAQLQFLSDGLDATDHNAPDWLATDLISLRNKSGRLQDDMKRFRDKLQSEDLAVKRVRVHTPVARRSMLNDKTKTTNKRLSIEGAKRSTPTTQTPKPTHQAISPATGQSPTPRAKPALPDNGYVTEHIDVTEEVNRRLQESRLRRLMETPSTSQKRKRETFDELRSESAAETDAEDGYSRNGYSGSEYDGTPTKRLKSSGTFDQMLKRKENGGADKGGERQPVRADFKRRRV
jgi:hypothetical protein